MRGTRSAALRQSPPRTTPSATELSYTQPLLQGAGRPANIAPIIRNMPEAVAITFTAGFGDAPEDIPEPIRTNIKMRVGHLFEHRESVTMGSGFITETPDGADDFVRDYKTWSF